MKIIIHKWVLILSHFIYTIFVIVYLMHMLKSIYPVKDYTFGYIAFGIISTIYGRILGRIYRAYGDSDDDN